MLSGIFHTKFITELDTKEDSKYLLHNINKYINKYYLKSKEYFRIYPKLHWDMRISKLNITNQSIVEKLEMNNIIDIYTLTIIK